MGGPSIKGQGGGVVILPSLPTKAESSLFLILPGRRTRTGTTFIPLIKPGSDPKVYICLKYLERLKTKKETFHNLYSDIIHKYECKFNNQSSLLILHKKITTTGTELCKFKFTQSIGLETSQSSNLLSLKTADKLIN